MLSQNAKIAWACIVLSLLLCYATRQLPHGNAKFILDTDQVIGNADAQQAFETAVLVVPS